ncbi:MAG: sigma-70 family RNA polymerase sigma factor [Oscillospiraceae bacterium]|nr:sigma-70 family RNA polymerase sigma factor [Oscillospiraceae bacterium]
MDSLSNEAMVKKYADMVYRLALVRTGNSWDADEVFQEVFLRYFRKKPVFTDENHRKAWLLKVTVNCSKKLQLSLWQKRFVRLDESIPFTEKEDINLFTYICRLPQKYRDVIHLFYYEDMSCDEIAQLLGRKPSTVRTQLTRARAMLKEILQEEDYV